MSVDAALSFLKWQRQGFLVEKQIPIPPQPPAAEPSERMDPTPHDALTPDLVSQHLATPQELDRLWGRMLDALESGEITRSDGRRLARSLGQIRQSLQRTPSDTGMKKVPSLRATFLK
ncbi:MAG TPA: hypothetical protein DCS88_06020 [Alphaproteobacteria bacterium]|nr:hypothetical protein [Alphaproteobacteria bacterium]